MVRGVRGGPAAVPTRGPGGEQRQWGAYEGAGWGRSVLDEPRGPRVSRAASAARAEQAEQAEQARRALAPWQPRPQHSPSPATPASLALGAPQRAAAGKRWCEQVTVEFRNTGGSPARSGTVTFATHIIGALGVDWATIRTSQPLPAPIAAGSTRSETYTVCLESWRVPLGMRVETRDVSAVWE